MSDVDTAPSGLGELPCIGWELDHLTALIDDLWTRLALHPHEVHGEADAIRQQANRLNELVRDIERYQRRAA
jgi:hypothetical protein